MVYMKKCIPFLLYIFLIPFFSNAESSAGIPSGGLWFSKEPFFAGEQIKVSTIVYNATTNDIVGSLELMDKGTLIEKKEVTLSAGQNKVIDFDVVISEGKHVFSIKISGGDFNIKDGVPLALKTKSGAGAYVVETTKVVRDALKDTDKDGQADINDIDIDGDSLTNEKETKLGTNLYNPDTDNDGILDGADKNPLKFDSLPSETKSITESDTKEIANKVEQVIPASIVNPIANAATPVIGKMESIRVDEANRNSVRVSNSIDDIIEKVGTAKVLGAQTQSTSSKNVVTKGITGKPSGFEVFKTSFTGDNFSKTPFDYVKLFLLVLYQFILSHSLIFYIVIALILVKIIIIIKRKVFNKNE